MKNLIEKIIYLRKAKGWNQAELARQVSRFGKHVVPQNIQQLEAGAVKQPRFILELSKALNVSMETLLNESITIDSQEVHYKTNTSVTDLSRGTRKESTLENSGGKNVYITLQSLNLKGNTPRSPVNKPDFIRNFDVLKNWATEYIAPEDMLKNMHLLAAPDNSNVAAGIYHGDPVFIDALVVHYTNDGFYALLFRGEPRIKYLRGNEAENCIELVSFEGMGEKVSKVKEGDEDKLCILGKVHAWWTLKRFPGVGG